VFFDLGHEFVEARVTVKRFEIGIGWHVQTIAVLDRVS
jgi:hypothetical protein